MSQGTVDLRIREKVSRHERLPGNAGASSMVAMRARRSLAWSFLVVIGLGAGASSRSAEAQGPCAETAAAADLVRAGDELAPLDLAGALRKYEAARATAPRSTRVLAKLAAAQERRESFADALEAWQAASALDPRHAGFVYGTARALVQLERWPEALDALSATLAIDERHAEAHASFAAVVMRLYERPSRDREAAQHLRRAIELAPQEVGSYARLGEHLLRLGFPREAGETLQAGLERAADDKARFPLRLLLAELAETTGDDAQAIDQLTAAKASCGDCSEPAHIVLPFLLGSAHARARPPRNAEATAHLSTFVKRACKGASAMRYRDACRSAHALLSKVAPFP